MDLTRKARLVARGHMTDPPKESTYSRVVSRDSIRIAFTLAALNDLDVLSADVQGAYLNAPTKEKVYTIAGLEFGANNGIVWIEVQRGQVEGPHGWHVARSRLREL